MLPTLLKGAPLCADTMSSPITCSATCRRTSGCRPTLRSAPSERGRTRRGVGPPRRRLCHDCGPARTLGPGREPRRTDGRCPATALMMDHIFGPAQRPPSRLPCGAASADRARARATRVRHSAEGGPRGVRPQAVRLWSSAAAAVGCPRAWPAGLGAVARWARRARGRRAACAPSAAAVTVARQWVRSSARATRRVSRLSRCRFS